MAAESQLDGKCLCCLNSPDLKNHLGDLSRQLSTWGNVPISNWRGSTRALMKGLRGEPYQQWCWFKVGDREENRRDSRESLRSQERAHKVPLAFPFLATSEPKTSLGSVGFQLENQSSFGREKPSWLNFPGQIQNESIHTINRTRKSPSCLYLWLANLRGELSYYHSWCGFGFLKQKNCII